MMAIMLTKPVLAALLVAATAVTAAADPRVAVHSDVTSFAFKGHGFGIGIQAAPHWTLVVANGSEDLPAFAAADGFAGRVRNANIVIAQYYPDADNKGFYVSAVAGALQ